MRKYIIISDSCCGLDKSTREQYDIEYIPMSISYNGKTMPASLDWEQISIKDYYDLMRSGTRVFTSQITKQSYVKTFEKYIKNGYDILSISCSSALSASVKASILAKEELKIKYPEAKIFCIDSLISGYGLGILCIIASIMRTEKKSLEETASFIEKIKLNSNQFGTVAELKYLKQAGRISTSKALFGTLFNVKPIIISDKTGQNVSIEKAKGRKRALERMAELTVENYTGDFLEDIFIAQADCEKDANILKELLAKNFPSLNDKIHIGCIDPILGASCGPETLAVYFMGKEVTT